ncbi:MAG: DNA-directed RNA polymerase subunit N [Candidatus Poseidoniaceae archaeon]
MAHKWDEFNNKLTEGTSVDQALDEVGLERYCCRRMYVGHIDLIEEIVPFSAQHK